MADRIRESERSSRRRRPSSDAGAVAEQPAHPLLQLQRHVGNRQVAQMLQRQPGEEEELQMQRDPALQREAEGGELEEEEMQMQRDPALQREAAPEVGLAGGDLSTATTDRINARRGSGAPLDTPTRTRMESAFDTDLSGVRLHTDSESAQLNRSVGAKAFTIGSDIFFGQGAAPSDSKLLAHEMTHVVQQGSGGAAGTAGAMRVTAADDHQEREADAAAAAITAAPVQRHADEHNE
ncbi:MAG TPA: DUF4157 domain-containing protein [Roseiflexaceae bacterium]|nr:DUF4157 domain-containing protein [Roseiflexaceae bacterium]